MEEIRDDEIDANLTPCQIRAEAIKKQIKTEEGGFGKNHETKKCKKLLSNSNRRPRAPEVTRRDNIGETRSTQVE